MSKKKFRKYQQARKQEKIEWKFLADLHKASIQLDGSESHAAKSLINWHRERGYLTPAQTVFAANLIAKVAVRGGKRASRAGKVHYLYAISDGKNVKLGFSINPQSRAKELQTGHPVKLALLWKMECGDSPATATQAERKLHRYCNAHRRHGEWFDIKCMALVKQFELKRSTDAQRKEEMIELEIVDAARCFI